MNDPGLIPAALDPLRADIEAACAVIAPNWPLDRQIAVNPFWGLVDRSFCSAASHLESLAGIRMALPRGEYLRAWREGAIAPRHIERAQAEHASKRDVDAAVKALMQPASPPAGLPLLSDALDIAAGEERGPRWREVLTQQVSQYCASYFDRHCAHWQRPGDAGLFDGWRTELLADHAIESLMNAPGIRARARELPSTARAAIAWSIERLRVPAAATADLLALALLRINGWASWCAYLRWEAGLVDGEDDHLEQLLAIRLGWEALLHDGRYDESSPWADWQRRLRDARAPDPAPGPRIDRLWQRAQEIAYQDHLIGQLVRAPAAAPSADGAPDVQAVFCIDVRSERMRRALESADARIQTHGFAGFFGLPIQYSRSARRIPGRSCPGCWHRASEPAIRPATRIATG
jgi:uncharacterized protein YbcC (UPF0753/DUF2309 family)